MSFPSGQDLLAGGRKPCARCGETLPLEAFPPKPHLSSGRDSWRRASRAEYLREWRAARKGAAA